MSLTSRKRERSEEPDEDSFESKQKVSKADKPNVVYLTNGDIETSQPEENFTKSSLVTPERTKPTSGECSEFSELKTVCFACESEGVNLIKCALETCDKFYHSKCLKKLPASKSESNACSLHVCLSCYNLNPRNSQIAKGDMYKCSKCPTAFHTKEECYLPGAVILSDSVMSCPSHFSPSEQRGYCSVANLFFCVECGCNEDLVFCNSCPCAIHKKCSKAGNFINDKSICNRCSSRRSNSLNDVVWAKVYNHRWWPAKVLNPKNVPSSVKNMPHFKGEFPIQFYGTNEYYWTQNSRVYPFILKRICIEAKNLKHNFKKTVWDLDFENSVQLACKVLSDKRIVSAVEKINPKKPPPYKHIKSNRPIGRVQIYSSHNVSDPNPCGCKADDPNPCGYDSLCLNRSMCSECFANVCEAGQLCQNQKFQKLEYAPVKPFLTSTRAWGLKCLTDIKKGHFVIEYCGDLIDEEECERRIKHKQETGDTNFYFCTLDSSRIIDAGPKGNFSRFINHSCDPNCETQKWIVNGDARVGIFAKKDIPAGSEVTFDYQMDFSHYEKLKCNCGSKRCSGLIGKKPQNGVMLDSDSDGASESVSPSPEPNNNDRNVTKKVNATEKKKNLTNGNGLKKVGRPKKQNDSEKGGSTCTKKVSSTKYGHKKDKPLCFKCKTGGKLLHCSLIECGKSFHVRCLRPGMDTDTTDWECQCHFCKKCGMLSSYQCYKCPNSYCVKHVINIPKSGKFACPKHSKEK